MGVAMSKAKEINPNTAWRRVLLAVPDRHYYTPAEAIAEESGVKLRSVKPYLSQFIGAGLVERALGIDGPVWSRVVDRTLVNEALTLHDLKERFNAERGEV